MVVALQQEGAVDEMLLQAEVVDDELLQAEVVDDELLQAEVMDDELLQLGVAANDDESLHIGDHRAVGDGSDVSDVSYEISFFKNMDPAWAADFPMYQELPCEGLIRNAGDPDFSKDSITFYEEEVEAFLREKEKDGAPEAAEVSVAELEERPKTPRRRLTFGAHMTPEQANSRATPGATPTKRAQDDVEMVGEEEMKRRKLSLDKKLEVKGIQQLDSKPGSHITLKPSVVEHLKNEKTSRRSKSTPRRVYRRQRLPSTPILGQRKITDMMGNSPTPSTIDKKGRLAANLLGTGVGGLIDCKTGGEKELFDQPDLGNDSLAKM